MNKTKQIDNGQLTISNLKQKFSIFHFPFSVSEEGFSIVEALIVATIVGVMGVILTDLLSRTINGGNKTELLNTVKQNGQLTLNVLTQTMRQSTNVVCHGTIVGTSEETIVLVESGGQYGRFHYFPPTATDNGWITHELLIDPASPADQLIPDPTIPPANFCTLNGVSGDPFLSVSPSTLTDTNTITGISVLPPPSTGQIFSCTPVPGSPECTEVAGSPVVVNIDMYIKAPIKAASDYTSQVGDTNGIDFSTSVQLI